MKRGIISCFRLGSCLVFSLKLAWTIGYVIILIYLSRIWRAIVWGEISSRIFLFNPFHKFFTCMHQRLLNRLPILLPQLPHSFSFFYWDPQKHISIKTQVLSYTIPNTELEVFLWTIVKQVTYSAIWAKECNAVLDVFT
jgi:hypothetical protein